MTIPSTAPGGMAGLAADRCPGLDEVLSAARALAERNPRVCRLRTIGASRAGEPLLMLSVGGDGADDGADGEEHGQVLVVAGAHANEPVGGASAVELASRIVAGRIAVAGRAQAAGAAGATGAAWHFVLCLDPDGTRLAQAGGPDTGRSLFEHYRGFFRPAMAEQPEWAPSIGLLPPESRALLHVVEELRPGLQCSLHSADVGGSYLQLTADIPGIVAPFTASAAALGIPAEAGPYDAFHWPSPGPGVYVMPPPGSPERFAANAEDARTSTWLAPHRYGGRTLVVEAPLWAAERLADPTPEPRPRAALAEVAARMRHHAELLAPLLAEARARGLAADGPLLRGAEGSLAVCRPLAEEWQQLSSSYALLTMPPLTRAHLASLETTAYRIPLRAAAMLRRALAPTPTPAPAPGEPVQPVRSDPRGESLRAHLEALLHEWCTEYAHRFAIRRIPVAHQIEHHIRTVQAAASLTPRPSR